MATTSPAADSMESCAFFDKLPAEMRNRIYDLSFSPDHDDDAEVHLLQSAPPEKALLLTCRQAYAEASEIYKDAYRKYWTTTRFFCERDSSGKPDKATVVTATDAIGDANIQHISRLEVRFHFTDDCVTKFKLVDSRGGWLKSDGMLLCPWVAPSRFNGSWLFVAEVSQEAMEAHLAKSTTRSISLKRQVLSWLGWWNS